MKLGAATATVGSSSPPRTEQRVIDTRMIGKPECFYGERDKFKDWSFLFKAYMSAVNPTYLDAFTRIEQSPVPMVNAVLSPRSVDLSSQLYFILVMMSRGKALDKISTVDAGDGFEAWRVYAEDYDPRIRTRRVGLLVQILTAKFGGDLSQALDQFDKLIKEYDSHDEGSLSARRAESLASENSTTVSRQA